MKSMLKTMTCAMLLFTVFLSACGAPSTEPSTPGEVSVSSLPSQYEVSSSVSLAPPESEADDWYAEFERYVGTYKVDPQNFTEPVPEGVEIPVWGDDRTLEMDILNCGAMIEDMSVDIQSYYKSPYFEYGHKFNHQQDYIGAFYLTTPDDVFDRVIMHRFDVALMKDGQPVGQAAQYYVSTAEYSHPYYYDEPAGQLCYIVRREAISHLADDDGGRRWYGIALPEQAMANIDNALAAYVQFLGGTAGASIETDSWSYIIPPSTSDEDLYDPYFISEHGEASRHTGTLDGLIYINCADPTLWQVFDDQTHSYRALRLDDGRFEEIPPAKE